MLYFTAAVFAAAVPPVEFARGIYTMLHPVSARLASGAAFYGFLVVSFLPLFTEEFERIRLAQSFRGAGFDGGLILAPTHHVQLDTPLENFWAMVKTITQTPS